MNGHLGETAGAPSAPRAAPQARRSRVHVGAAALLVALALAGTACAAASGGIGRGRPIAPGPVAPPASSAPGVVAAPEGVDAALQQVIERGNAEQVQAIASHDPSVMADTSTSRYYQELVQTNQRLLDSGVVSIKLVTLEWGPVTVTGTTATATTYETWRTTLADGTTDESRDRNVYTLVRDGGSWRIDADAHPEDGQTPPGGRTAPTPPQPRAPAPQAPVGQNTSTNWSGYAATGGTFTAVSGTWTVPHAAPDGAFGAGAAWVGIGGLRSRDLIQAGTQEVVSGSGHVSYQAWIETLPQASQPVPLAVAPGDLVTVSITRQGTDTWVVSLANTTTGRTYERTVPYASSLSSAEWIEEAPSVGRRGVVPLDDFGTIQFSHASAVKDGRAVTIAQAGARPVSLVGAGGQTLAQPSALGTDGASFSVTRTSGPTAGQGGQGGQGVPRGGIVPPIRRRFAF